MFTRHGHQIPETPAETPSPASVGRCGGPELCRECQQDVWLATGFSDGKPMDYQLKAKIEVVEWYNRYAAKKEIQLTVDDVFVVWFVKALENWKGLLATTNPDNMYFECTYSGAKKEMYLDAYVKMDNRVISDRI